MRKLFVIVIAIFSFLTACTKIDTTTFGSELISPLDPVNTFDTLLDVTTANFPEENIPRVYKTNDHVIGVIINDPLFGATTASAYFELKPTTYPFYFPGKKADLIADSVVLVLSYKGVFGDTTIPQTWNVYEVDKNSEFLPDSAYPVSAKVGVGSLLGSKSLDIRTFNDSVNYGFENAVNQVRIKLQPGLADLLMKQFDSSATGSSLKETAYHNDSLFRKNFAGLAVVPQGGGNALIRVNLADTNTKLALYYNYKSDTSPARIAAVSYFRYTPGAVSIAASANANSVIRDWKSSAVTSYLNTGKTDEVFIQTSPGTFATVKIPGLKTFQNVIVHRAELIAEQDPADANTDGQFFAPRYLLLSAYDSVNKYKINIPNDFIYDANSGPNIETFGGLLSNKSVPSVGITGSYTFNLTRYVQGIVSRKDSSYTLRLSAPVNDSLKYTPPHPFQSSGSTMLYLSPAVANNIAAGRVRLGGGTNTRVKMRLRIIYSKI